MGVVKSPSTVGPFFHSGEPLDWHGFCPAVALSRRLGSSDGKFETNQAKPQKMKMYPEKGPFQRERILFQPFHFFRVNIEFSAE